MARELAKVLDYTGSFSSTQHSVDFVRAVALEGIIRHALCSGSTFKIGVTSSNMTLLFEASSTVFDDTRMANDFGSNGMPAPERRDRIAGMTEVGVEKSLRGAGRSRRPGILLKTKAVLGKDVTMN